MSRVPILPMSEESVARAADVIRTGGLVAFPTDTVYGVGAHPFMPRAVERLYRAKRRPTDRPIPVLVASRDDVSRVAQEMPEWACRLADAFWPGPLTIVVPRRADLPPEVSSGPGVGVRMPDHEGALALLRAAGGALAATSANLSGRPAPINAEEVARQIGDSVELILDGGICPGGLASTVVTMEGDRLRVIREGPISIEDMLSVLRRRP